MRVRVCVHLCVHLCVRAFAERAHEGPDCLKPLSPNSDKLGQGEIETEVCVSESVCVCVRACVRVCVCTLSRETVRVGTRVTE